MMNGVFYELSPSKGIFTIGRMRTEKVWRVDRTNNS